MTKDFSSIDKFRETRAHAACSIHHPIIRMSPRASALLLFIALQGFCATTPAATPAPATVRSETRADELAATAEGRALREAWSASEYRFTPATRTAYLKFIKAETLSALTASGKTLPKDFLAWIDSDPVVESTVYGARKNPVGILLGLRSLEIDLGADTVRRDYTQMALALAVAHAKTGETADIKPRAPLVLRIPGDPRVRVNTKDTSRPLDTHDHIINFLEDHAPFEEEVVVGHREELPELKYDDKGVAIPAPKGKAKKIAITEKRKRALVAADVMASKALQNEFNAYMASHGESVRIDCGDRVIFRDRTASVDSKSPEGKGILAAYKLFRAAYETKGRLPEKRDASPTPSEQLAYLIRNDKFRFPAETAAQRNWPRYPLTAPWPTLTLLALDNQPLREKEHIWAKFRDTGKTRTYGEYIGPIAQQFDYQSARRIAPFAFTYGTYQMMDKDGGVCGTMANMGVRTNNTLGIPSCTAGQPGHCALIAFAFDKKTGDYRCHGGQYATGGDDKTHPHGRWVFGDTDAPRRMVWHQSVARSVNAGLKNYLDSMIAHQLFARLTPAEKASRGMTLLESALAIAPTNFVLVEDALALADSATAQFAFFDNFKAAQAALDGKTGARDAGGLYEKTVRELMFARIQKLPIPTDRKQAAATLARLEKEKCDNPGVIAGYRLAAEGLEALLARTESDFAAHLAGQRDEKSCEFMAATMKAVSDKIADKKRRKTWTLALYRKQRGAEVYFSAKNKVLTDDTSRMLARLAGEKIPGDADLIRPMLIRVADELKNSVAGTRDMKVCKPIASRIAALDKAIKDPSLKAAWADALTQIIAGKESFTPANAKKNAAPLRDPCADAIAKLREAKA